MNVNKIKQQVTAIINNLNNSNNINPFGNGAYLRIEGVFVPKALKIVPEFAKLLHELTNDSQLTKTLSKRAVVFHIVSIIKNVYKKSAGQAEIVQYINDFKEYAENVKEYKVYVPLKGIKLEVDSLDINDFVKIIKLDANTIDKIVGTSKEVLVKYDCFAAILTNIDPLVVREAKIEDIKDCFTSAAVQVSVRASEFIKAKETALEVAKIIVCYLRLVDYLTWDTENLNLRFPGYGVLEENLKVVIEDKTKTYIWDDQYESEEFDVDKDMIDDLQEFGVRFFNLLLDVFIKSDLEEVQRAIIQALILFGESRVESNDSIRYLKLMLAVECLLNTSKADPVTVTLSERAAFILGSEKESRLRIFQSFKHLYSLRSDIVHHGFAYMNYENILDLEVYVSKLITKFLTDDLLFSVGTKIELSKVFDSMKFE